jgi:hypothetical protein
VLEGLKVHFPDKCEQFKIVKIFRLHVKEKVLMKQIQEKKDILIKAKLLKAIQ